MRNSNILIVVLEGENAKTEKSFFDCLGNHKLEYTSSILGFKSVKCISFDYGTDLKTKEQKKLASLDLCAKGNIYVIFLIDRDCWRPINSYSQKMNNIKKYLKQNFSFKNDSFKELMLPEGYAFEYVLCMCFPNDILKRGFSNPNNFLIRSEHSPFKKKEEWIKSEIEDHNIDKISKKTKSNSIQNLRDNFSKYPAPKQNDLQAGQISISNFFTC